MLNAAKIENFFSTNSSFGIFILRVFIGSRLLYGVIDNVISWDKLIEFSHFLEAHNFPMPIFNAIISVYVQLICAILVLIGYKVRIASFLLVINFIIALVFVHLAANDTIEGMTPALAMLFGSLTLLFTGGGKISLSNYLDSKK